VARLEDAGAAAVYPTGTPLEEMVESMRALSAVGTGRGARA
jgi:methylmalonyl-CoA mutase cobalamin-binding subunit